MTPGWLLANGEALVPPGRDGQKFCDDKIETWCRRHTGPGAHAGLTRLHSAGELDEFYAANDLVRPAG